MKTKGEQEKETCGKKRNDFVVDECKASDTSSDEDEDSCTDQETFIDDEEVVHEDSCSFYRQLRDINPKQGEQRAFDRGDFIKKEKIELLRKKGVYCYDYMTGFEKFNETQLPSKEYFYNKLNEVERTDKEYEHAQKVWNVFDCQTMRDYHDVYLLSDVLILADVFENFRKMAHETYGLEPLHYYSLPGFSWDAALKYTGVQAELIKDIDMHMMIKKGMRGCISVISHRYAKANHSDAPDFDPKKPPVYLMYLDANGLYAWAMTQPLPHKGFKWLEPKLFDLNMLGKGKGYILEIDCEFPDELHDKFNDYPLAPEQMIITREMLSPLQQSMVKASGKVQKLVPNLRSKTKYVIHHRTLKKYMDLGMLVTKVHRVIEFEEEAWLKPFIELNTEKRKEAATNGDNAGVAMFKLMSNAIFGKTCENLEKRVNIELLTSSKILKKRIAKPNFKRSKIFREDLVGVNRQRLF